MAVIIDIRRRIHLTEDPPTPPPARRLPPLAGPAVLHWLGTGLLTWMLVSGRIPLDRVLDGGGQDVPAVEPAPLPGRPPPPSGPPSRPMRQRAASIALSSPSAEPTVATPVEAATATRPVGEETAEGPHLALRDPVAAKRAVTDAAPSDPVAAKRAVTGADLGAFVGDGQQAAGPPGEVAGERPPGGGRVRTQSPRQEASPPVHGSGLPSCEAARARASEVLDMTRAGRRSADLPREALSRVLDDGSYLGGCGVPETMSVDICVAVQEGRVVGVTVSTTPDNDRIRRCVAYAAARLAFPPSPHLDVARTRFEALR